jgi:MFS family permease
MMMLAMALQVVGILIPIFSNSIILNLISGMLFGATFIGLVALFMNFAGQLAGKNPVFIMGVITAAYGVGQVVAPLYCVALIEQFGNYNAALYLTAFIVVIGIILLQYAKTRLLTNGHAASNL